MNSCSKIEKLRLTERRFACTNDKGILYGCKSKEGCRSEVILPLNLFVKYMISKGFRKKIKVKSNWKNNTILLVCGMVSSWC